MDLLSLLLGGGVGVAIVTAVSVITQLVLNKKLKTPADRTAEVTAVLTFFKEGIADSRADRIALEETTKDLRDYISRLEKNSREDFALRVKLEERIADLERRIKEKDDRIQYLEQELARYTQSKQFTQDPQ
jgi:predicted RNase H-like nuclease (RuvC/YqgF family)